MTLRVPAHLCSSLLQGNFTPFPARNDARGQASLNARVGHLHEIPPPLLNESKEELRDGWEPGECGSFGALGVPTSRAGISLSISPVVSVTRCIS
jgi:hypothetical protein